MGAWESARQQSRRKDIKDCKDTKDFKDESTSDSEVFVLAVLEVLYVLAGFLPQSCEPPTRSRISIASKNSLPARWARQIREPAPPPEPLSRELLRDFDLPAYYGTRDGFHDSVMSSSLMGLGACFSGPTGR